MSAEAVSVWIADLGSVGVISEPAGPVPRVGRYNLLQALPLSTPARHVV